MKASLEASQRQTKEVSVFVFQDNFHTLAHLTLTVNLGGLQEIDFNKFLMIKVEIKRKPRTILI